MRQETAQCTMGQHTDLVEISLKNYKRIFQFSFLIDRKHCRDKGIAFNIYKLH